MNTTHKSDWNFQITISVQNFARRKFLIVCSCTSMKEALGMSLLVFLGILLLLIIIVVVAVVSSTMAMVGGVVAEEEDEDE